MVTSKSTEVNYTAGVSIFSGRPDPTWTLSEAVGSKLRKLFDELERSEDPAASAPPLGYRGAFLRDDAGHEWFAYREVVTVTSHDNAEVRKDTGRAFEREIIGSAPEGLIPPALLTSEFN